MGVRVRWSPQSREHLIAIRAHIREHDANAAERVRWRIVETVKLLRTLPRLGHAGRRQGTREFVIPHLPYIVVYRIAGDELVILGVFHGRRDR